MSTKNCKKVWKYKGLRDLGRSQWQLLMEGWDFRVKFWGDGGIRAYGFLRAVNSNPEFNNVMPAPAKSLYSYSFWCYHNQAVHFILLTSQKRVPEITEGTARFRRYQLLVSNCNTSIIRENVYRALSVRGISTSGTSQLLTAPCIIREPDEPPACHT